MNTNQITVPENIGLIMDGNGRWAQQLGLSRTEGHTKGIENMIRLLTHAFSGGVKTATCFALSTENMKRDKAELDHILSLIGKVFDYFVSVFSKIRVSISYVGNLDLIPQEIRSHMKRTEDALRIYRDSGKILYVCIAYGGRDEIIRAVNTAIRNGKEVSEKDFLSMLSVPVEPDLIIRTGGKSGCLTSSCIRAPTQSSISPTKCSRILQSKIWKKPSCGTLTENGNMGSLTDHDDPRLWSNLPSTSTG